ncbi:hypothetical protein EJ08DRAFT_333289 [Tothia fuscella]|uniref:SET domain-containing protein n=1 Tax=Tothia fuscella TaxID=1048955 RepID=A0A9P4TX08_9PEZI|nr:hypothetical protein EJ08DRAFT_333289 [Tothia fuscella]
MDLNSWNDSHGSKPGFTYVYGNISLVNYSCCPNCILIGQSKEGDANVMVGTLRSLVDIQKGQELTIDYLDEEVTALMDQDDRHSEVARRWGFECSCEFCSPVSRADATKRKKRIRENAKRFSLVKDSLPALEAMEEVMYDYVEDLRVENRIAAIEDIHKKALQVYKDAYKNECKDGSRKDHYMIMWKYHARKFSDAAGVYHGDDSYDEDAIKATELLWESQKAAVVHRRAKEAKQATDLASTRGQNDIAKSWTRSRKRGATTEEEELDEAKNEDRQMQHESHAGEHEDDTESLSSVPETDGEDVGSDPVNDEALLQQVRRDPKRQCLVNH